MLCARSDTPLLCQAGLFILLSEFFCGVLLGFVFIQSHNGMEVYSDKRDFVASQLASTRNVHGSIFNDWRVPCSPRGVRLYCV